MNANEYEGYNWASRKCRDGATAHELRTELMGLEALDEDELDWLQGAYRFIQEREEAGYE